MAVLIWNVRQELGCRCRQLRVWPHSAAGLRHLINSFDEATWGQKQKHIVVAIDFELDIYWPNWVDLIELTGGWHGLEWFDWIRFINSNWIGIDHAARLLFLNEWLIIGAAHFDRVAGTNPTEGRKWKAIEIQVDFVSCSRGCQLSHWKKTWPKIAFFLLLLFICFMSVGCVRLRNRKRVVVSTSSATLWFIS